MKKSMLKKTYLYIIIFLLLVIVFVGCSKTAPVRNESEESRLIKEYDCFDNKLQINQSDFLPEKDVLNQCGNGIQLLDGNGKIINGDITLDGSSSIECYVRVTWLENYEGNLSLIVLNDNQVQKLTVDNQDNCIEKYDFKMDSKSAINIPLKLSLKKTTTKEVCNVAFVLLYNNESKNEKEDLGLKNSCNVLFYKAQNVAYGHTGILTEAKNYFKQPECNAELVKANQFYSCLTKENNDNYSFPQAKESLSPNDELYLYAMGNGKVISQIFSGDNLVNAFDECTYLTCNLLPDNFVKQKVNLKCANSKDEITVLSIEIDKKVPSAYHIQALKMN